MDRCRTIMLIEANAMDRERGEKAIQDIGYRVQTAPCRAWADGAANPVDPEIDLVILDLSNAASNGHGLLARLIRPNGRPRILLTSGFCEFAPASGLLRELGCEFIQKPFSPADLADKVKSILPVDIHSDRAAAAA